MAKRPGPIPCLCSKAFIFMESLLIGCLFFAYTAYSQSINSDNELNEAVDFAIQTLPANQLGLYNGRDYMPTTITAGGHPYFSTEEFAPETITFHGITYREIFLIFDASRQSVVIEDHAGNKICPVEEKIESFTVGVHTFKRLTDITGLDVGFYDVLVDGKLFARRSKSARGMQWKSSTTYYFLNNDQLFQVASKKSVLESMADKEEEIRHYIRLNKLSFNKKKETNLVEVVKFYSTLKQR